jgi:hypothetical protein
VAGEKEGLTLAAEEYVANMNALTMKKEQLALSPLNKPVVTSSNSSVGSNHSGSHNSHSQNHDEEDPLEWLDDPGSVLTYFLCVYELNVSQDRYLIRFS